ILGMSIYYTHKLEGLARMWVDAGEGPISTDHYYDAAQRALYVRVNDTLWNWYAMPSLPRFKTHVGEAEFVKKDLRDIRATVQMREGDGMKEKELGEFLGLK